MKYKKGDKVRIKSWNAMEREFGLRGGCDINITPYAFVQSMRELCGKPITVNYGTGDHYVTNDTEKFISDDMIEGYAFEHGDEVEVSDDGETWFARVYLGYIPGVAYGYTMTSKKIWELGSSPMNFDTYMYARPIQKAITINEILKEYGDVEIPSRYYDNVIKTIKKVISEI